MDKFNPQPGFEITPQMVNQILSVPQGNIYDHLNKRQAQELELQSAQTSNAIKQQQLQEYEVLDQVRQQMQQVSQSGADMDLDTLEKVFLEAGLPDQVLRVQERKAQIENQKAMQEYRKSMEQRRIEDMLLRQEQRAAREAREARSESRASARDARAEDAAKVRMLQTLARETKDGFEPTERAKAAMEELAAMSGMQGRVPVDFEVKQPEENKKNRGASLVKKYPNIRPQDGEDEEAFLARIRRGR